MYGKSMGTQTVSILAPFQWPGVHSHIHQPHGTKLHTMTVHSVHAQPHAWLFVNWFADWLCMCHKNRLTMSCRIYHQIGKLRMSRLFNCLRWKLYTYAYKRYKRCQRAKQEQKWGILAKIPTRIVLHKAVPSSVGAYCFCVNLHVWQTSLRADYHIRHIKG